MDIENILTNKHFVLKRTTKWIAINDPRPVFEKTFGTKRFGKLQGTGMYVTLEPVKAECEKLIVARGLTLRHVRSTTGDGRLYPGFDTVGVSQATLEHMVDTLCSVVDRHL